MIKLTSNIPIALIEISTTVLPDKAEGDDSDRTPSPELK